MFRNLVGKNIITFTVDENYLPFAKILVNSTYSEQFDNDRLNGADFLYHGGLIGINNNNSTLNVIKNIKETVKKEIFDWDIDERVLPYIIKNNVKILEVDKKYKDEDLNDNSILWSGSGKTKFNNDRYIDECKKYK
jgi:hypothetical protein